MHAYFPGTAIEISPRQRGRTDSAAEIIDNIFSAGGLVLSQVSKLTGLEYYIIQNWVKRGYIPPPVKKRYHKNLFCRILIINILRETLKFEEITELLSTLSVPLGRRGEEKPEIVLATEFDVYNYYVNLVLSGEETPIRSLETAIKDYKEPFPGAKKTLSKVLGVMYHAGLAAENAKKSIELLYSLG